MQHRRSFLKRALAAVGLLSFGKSLLGAKSASDDDEVIFSYKPGDPINRRTLLRKVEVITREMYPDFTVHAMESPAAPYVFQVFCSRLDKHEPELFLGLAEDHRFVCSLISLCWGFDATEPKVTRGDIRRRISMSTRKIIY